MSVYLKCVKVGSKLRVRITTPGYLSDANCQFPRSLRAEGRIFKVWPREVSLAAGPRGKYFYRVRGAITIVTDDEDAIGAAATVALDHVYDDGGECVVCLEAPKTRIMVPCGHFCMCDECNAQLRKRECPMCRTAIALTVAPDQVE